MPKDNEQVIVNAEESVKRKCLFLSICMNSKKWRISSLSRRKSTKEAICRGRWWFSLRRENKQREDGNSQSLIKLSSNDSLNRLRIILDMIQEQLSNAGQPFYLSFLVPIASLILELMWRN